MSVFIPHEYQEMVLGRMSQGPSFLPPGMSLEETIHVLALLLDPGMGKTPTCLEDFRRMREECLVSRALVIAPLRPCYSVWPNEVEKWEQFADLDLRVIHGKTRTVEQMNAAEISVMNPSGLKWLEKNRANVKPFDTIYVDESTDFKTVNSQRSRQMFRAVKGAVYKYSSTGKSKKLIKMFRTIPRRFILTGTPAPNGLENLHGQFGILDPSILGESLKAFRERFWYHAHVEDRGIVWKPSERTAPLLYEAVAPFSVRLNATDHLDLPELVSVEHRTRLPDKVRALYKKLQQEMYIELAVDREIVALNAGVLSAKCRQVANGQVYLSEIGEVSAGPTRKSEFLHTAKCEALGDLWDENGQKPTLVVFEHRHEVDAIRSYFKKRFGWEPPFIHGGVSGEDGKKLEDEWNLGNLPMLLVHPQTASRGLNLQAGGHHVVWYCIPWDLEWYQQLIRRLWRQGQEAGRVFVHHIICEGTVDEKFMRALASKAETQDELFRYLEEK